MKGTVLFSLGNPGAGQSIVGEELGQTKIVDRRKSTILKCLAHLNVYKGEILFRGKWVRGHILIHSS